MTGWGALSQLQALISAPSGSTAQNAKRIREGMLCPIGWHSAGGSPWRECRIRGIKMGALEQYRLL